MLTDFVNSFTIGNSTELSIT